MPLYNACTIDLLPFVHVGLSNLHNLSNQLEKVASTSRSRQFRNEQPLSPKKYISSLEIQVA